MWAEFITAVSIVVTILAFLSPPKVRIAMSRYCSSRLAELYSKRNAIGNMLILRSAPALLWYPLLVVGVVLWMKHDSNSSMAMRTRVFELERELKATQNELLEERARLKALQRSQVFGLDP